MKTPENKTITLRIPTTKERVNELKRELQRYVDLSTTERAWTSQERNAILMIEKKAMAFLIAKLDIQPTHTKYAA